MSSRGIPSANRVQVGLVVAFASLTHDEQRAVQRVYHCTATTATCWESAFEAFGLKPIAGDRRGADILIYLGESSRFEEVAGKGTRRIPVIFVKSTVEKLLDHAPGVAPRYRMCAGVKAIAHALASAAPLAPTVDWKTLSWPESAASLTRLDEAEHAFVDTSIRAFRRAASDRGIRWITALPPGRQVFSVLLMMHDPAAAMLADIALRRWPQCTVLAGDGMVATRAPDGARWPSRLIRVRHWSPRIHSTSNRLFREAMGDEPLPDFDSSGMLFGTMCFLDSALAGGAVPARLEVAGAHPGPLGPMCMTPSGRPQPQRLVVVRGQRVRVLTIE